MSCAVMPDFSQAQIPRLMLWARLGCRHGVQRQEDEYLEDLHGHYDEHICTRQITVFRCLSCGRQRRMVRVLAATETVRHPPPSAPV